MLVVLAVAAVVAVTPEGQLRVLGTRREASSDDNFGPGARTRPLPVSRRFRITFRIAKIILAVVVTFAVAVGLLFVLTPSAGQATALARAQAREHHIAYPGFVGCRLDSHRGQQCAPGTGLRSSLYQLGIRPRTLSSEVRGIKPEKGHTLLNHLDRSG